MVHEEGERAVEEEDEEKVIEEEEEATLRFLINLNSQRLAIGQRVL